MAPGRVSAPRPNTARVGDWSAPPRGRTDCRRRAARGGEHAWQVLHRPLRRRAHAPFPHGPHPRRGNMEVVAARCAGLDVHKPTIVACALIAQEGRARPRKEYATFPTTAAGLASLAAWLKGLGVE